MKLFWKLWRWLNEPAWGGHDEKPLTDREVRESGRVRDLANIDVTGDKPHAAEDRG